MLISTQNDALSKVFGDEETIRILAKNGFDCIDFCMLRMTEPSFPMNVSGYLDYAKSLRRIADECNVKFNQSHAPLPLRYEEGNAEYNSFIMDAIERSIEVTAALGAEICVVHPITISGEEKRQLEVNFDYYRRLEKTARRCGVKIALENLGRADYKDVGRSWYGACNTPEQFCSYIDALGRDVFTGCLDFGHCGLYGIPVAEMIRKMGSDYISAIHVHDNDHITDMHTLPFTAKLDWPDITAALREIGYKGVFTFECDAFIERLPDELKISASKFMYETGKVLVGMIEKE